MRTIFFEPLAKCGNCGAELWTWRDIDRHREMHREERDKANAEKQQQRIVDIMRKIATERSGS